MCSVVDSWRLSDSASFVSNFKIVHGLFENYPTILIWKYFAISTVLIEFVHF